jgi:hypothetical protein
MSDQQNKILGFDIGGANTKVVLVEAENEILKICAHSLRYYPIWQKSKDELPTMLAEIGTSVGYVEGVPVCVTITAELSDAYETKREGILHVLASLEQAFPKSDLSIFTTAGTFHSAKHIQNDPLPAAASNWVATARWIAATYSDCIFIDIGSTTADIIPIRDGHLATEGHTDLARLLHCELVYTGVLRATIPSVAHYVPFRGRMCPISFEKFATMADVHLILGHITGEEYTTETADGRPPTLEYSYARLARIVCADFEEVTREDVDGFAQYLFQEQVNQITVGLGEVTGKFEANLPFILTGLGAECLGIPACNRVDAERERIVLSEELGRDVDVLSSAYAVAWCYFQDFIL